MHNAGIPPLTEAAMRYFDRQYLPDPSLGSDWRISPVVAPDVAGVAPALVVLAERDALHDEGLHYAQRLREAGVETLVRVHPGMIHGFINMGSVMRVAGETLDLAALLLRQRLLPVAAQE
ncbi:Carboxylesterase NlhH [Xanthomonas sacchari]|nr:Carboxylesterase NlhH [Xanthomonas sacchari]